ncbi:hypothetical protein [Psychrobacillus antarcticus]|uniref:hypothetical protein n=1 Tax=Psychrobacillus antarcticus TaxID=2879115 RepID=UPI00240781BE|nr:hypothetical protein [Psychrobacillus antarcticus]
MNKKNYILYFFTGIIVGMFLVIPLVEGLGLPSFTNVLVNLFGEPNEANKIIVPLLLLLIIFLIVLFPFRKYKKT